MVVGVGLQIFLHFSTYVSVKGEIRHLQPNFCQKSIKLHKSFFQIQAERPNMSDHDLKATAKVIRQKHGRRSIEPGLKQALTDRPKTRGSFFAKRQDVFQCTNNRIEQRWWVRASDLPGLIEFTLEVRKLKNKKVLFRLTMDGGKGFFKVCLNIIDIDGNTNTPDTPEAKQKRFSYDASTFSKDSGEKKMILLAIVPHISETYENTKMILEAMDFSTIASDMIYSMDLKLCNIMKAFRTCFYLIVFY